MRRDVVIPGKIQDQFQLIIWLITLLWNDIPHTSIVLSEVYVIDLTVIIKGTKMIRSERRRTIEKRNVFINVL